MKRHLAGGDMNRTMLLNAAVALGFVAATVAPSLLAIGCTGASDTSAFAVRGSSTVAVTPTSGKPLRPLGPLNRQLPAGLHALDLVALNPANTGPALSRRKPTVLNGGWVAYATAAPADQPSYYGWSGSDVFITRPGGQPKLVAGRGSRGEIWNVCPAFSPNGRMLAFGRRTTHGRTIRVVGVGSDGTIGPPRITLAVPQINELAPCPKWSADSSRIAYVDTRQKLVVRGLDGSRQPRRVGDPRLGDFNQDDSPAVGPSGLLVARRESASASGMGCVFVVSRSNGSHTRVISDQPCSYAIGGWSPDGRKLLVMRDVGGGFTMRAVSVDAPFTSTPIATNVPVNNARSWPGYGDVSWQPIPRR
jgi:hypothetical protein